MFGVVLPIDNEVEVVELAFVGTTSEVFPYPSSSNPYSPEEVVSVGSV